MWYGSYPHMGWFPPWGWPMGSPMMGGWGHPYGGMWQMPYYPPWGGFEAPGMSPYASPMTGGFGAPGMSPYASPMTGGFEAPGMSPFGPSMPPEQEIEFLGTQAQMLKDQLDQIDARIKELEKQSK